MFVLLAHKGISDFLKSNTKVRFFFYQSFRNMEEGLPNPNEIIEYLKKVGVKQIDIVKAMSIGKGTFNSWRNSANPRRRQSMSSELLRLYSKELSDMKLSVASEPAPTYATKNESDRYVELLEETVKDLKAQNEWLRSLIEEKNTQIREMLSRQ